MLAQKGRLTRDLAGYWGKCIYTKCNRSKLLKPERLVFWMWKVVSNICGGCC